MYPYKTPRFICCDNFITRCLHYIFPTLLLQLLNLGHLPYSTDHGDVIMSGSHAAAGQPIKFLGVELVRPSDKSALT